MSPDESRPQHANTFTDKGIDGKMQNKQMMLPKPIRTARRGQEELQAAKEIAQAWRSQVSQPSALAVGALLASCAMRAHACMCMCDGMKKITLLVGSSIKKLLYGAYGVWCKRG